jgi:hypothetical protein
MECFVQHHSVTITSNHCVRFHVFMAACMKMTAFWDIAQCSLEVDRSFSGVYCFCHQGDGGSTLLCSVTLLHRNYTVLYPRRLSSSVTSSVPGFQLKLFKHMHIKSNVLLVFQEYFYRQKVFLLL